MSAFATIAQLGAINLSALDYPQIIVQIVPPQQLFNGVATNIGGMVGTATWGPVNSAQASGNLAQYNLIFGPCVNRTYDMGSHATVYFAQGASFLYGVRVTDGTDTAASTVVPADTTAIGTFTETSTNNFIANDTLQVGNNTYTFKASIGTAGNVLIGASFASSAANLAAAINGTAGNGTTYTATAAVSNVTAAVSSGLITFSAILPGVGGNAYTFVYTAAGTAAGVASAATLSGGSGTSPAYATQVFTETSSNNFLAGDTVQVGNNTFTFVATLGTTAGNVLKGAAFANSAANLVAAINGTSGAGLTYLTPPNTPNIKASTVTTTITFTALTIGTSGNSLASVYSPSGTSAGTMGAGLFAGGINQTAGVTLTAKYTGSLGNTLGVLTQDGMKNGSYRVIVSMPGFQPEVYDNITGTGNAFWVNVAAAINSGNSTVRGPSNLCIATAGAGVGLPSTASVAYSFSGGTDGANGITTSSLVGIDVLPRTGMYALRNFNCSKAMLCDLSDTTSFLTQVAYGLSEGCEMIATTAAGDTIANAVNEMAAAGVDSFTISCMFGNWLYFLDTVNNVPLHLLSPQSAKMGVLCNLSPQNSALNKPIVGIVGTQRTVSNAPAYTSADLQLLGVSLMDVIDTPAQGGNYFACLFGKNCSSNIITQGDEYTQVTYYLAKSLLKIGGPYIGQTMTQSEMVQAQAAVVNFLAFIAIPAAQGGPGIIGTFTGQQPYQVILNATNNTQATAALGYQFAYVQVIYLSIVRYFVFSLEGGSSVTITTAPPSGVNTLIPTN